MPSREFWFDFGNALAAHGRAIDNMPAGGTRYSRTNMAFLRERAIARWRKRCPCCDSPMRLRCSSASTGRVPRDYRTQGHDISVSAGGSRDRWIYICSGCNTDQGNLSFANWAWRLKRNGDPRYPLVERVAAFMKEHAPWPTSEARGSRSGPSPQGSAPTTVSTS